MKLKQITFSFLFVLSCFFLISCQPSTHTEYPLLLHDQIMGTTYTVKVSTLPDSAKANEIKKIIRELLIRIDSQMSTYKPESEISMINSDFSEGWLPVSEELMQVLAVSKEISLASGGAFDITIGALVDLWGFGSTDNQYEKPDKKQIQEKLAVVGFKNLEFDTEQNKLKKNNSDIHIDLSAIAKGYAVDKVAEILLLNNMNDFMVEIGGEIKLSGTNKEHLMWRIAIEKPDAERRVIQKILSISNMAIATSGDYRNFYELDGIRFSHTIDPRTGQPITHKLASVTVLDKSAMKADGWATALMVLGPDAGFQVAEQQNIAAMFIIKSKDGFEEKATSAFFSTIKQ